MFCCESGTHVVDPAQSYYAGISYRAGTNFYNLTLTDPPPTRQPDDKCLDSSQAWFCRDLWVAKAKESIKDVDDSESHQTLKAKKRSPVAEPQEAPNAPREPAPQPQPQREPDADANAGSDYDAHDLPLVDPPKPADGQKLTAPNSVFEPVKIMVNPRCVTTYAGGSHTQLALDLFGPPDREEEQGRVKEQDVLAEWESAPDTFVCQEQQ